MNILTHWLRTFLPPLPVDDRQLAEDLTLRGIAVEGVHEVANGHLFEMDITTNRVDAMNHYGIAREAATIYNLPSLALDTSPEPRTSSPQPTQVPPSASSGAPTPNAVAPSAAASPPASSATSPSPPPPAHRRILHRPQSEADLQRRRRLQLRPPQAMGHPTHAFDLDRIEGGIIVRLAHPAESLKLLDGTTRTLAPDDLVIADEAQSHLPRRSHGRLGHHDHPQTRNILIESAWFEPASIRRSSRRHLLHTDASHRFERGADFNAAPTANHLVSQLILHTGGSLEGDLIDLITPAVQQKTATRPPIALSSKEVQRHLGTTLDPAEGLPSDLVEQYLKSLGCTHPDLQRSPDSEKERTAIESSVN